MKVKYALKKVWEKQKIMKKKMQIHPKSDFSEVTMVSLIEGRFFTSWATGKPTMVAAAAKSLQSCPTLWDPVDCSPPGSSARGIFQARVLEWGAIAFSATFVWAAVHGVAKSRTRLSDFTFTFHFHALEKEMATHSSVLAWRIPGTGEPGGLLSMGSHRVGHDWSELATNVFYVHM